MIDKQFRREVKNIYENELSSAFPSEDIVKLENILGNDHPEAQEFVAHFEEFCMLIAGSCTYVIGKKNIPKYQAQFLKEDFFSSYPQYAFLQPLLRDYPDLYKVMKNYETARELLVKIL